MMQLMCGVFVSHELKFNELIHLEVAVSVAAQDGRGEPADFHGENEAELRACALGFTITDLQAEIDGRPVKNLERYIHASPLFDLTMPEDNILEVPAGSTGQSVSNGAHLMLNPLSPGTHTVHLHAYVPEVDFTVDLNYEFIVGK